ncbi:MAG: LysR family transcriptional regulator [Eubacteriales bacterium]
MIDNLTLYKFFLEVAKSGSISGAARRLYVTQPAVSSGVAQLEGALGVKLFFRTSRGINLTPEGELLYDYVGAALTYLEAGEDKLRDIGGLNSGVLRVGASDMTLKYFLLDYIENFNREYPHVKLSITNNPTPQTLKALKNGLIDFCVISEPVELDSELESFPVKSIHDIVVCANTEQYAPLFDSPVDLDTLSRYPMIMLDRATSTRGYIESHLRAFGAPDSLLEPAVELAQSDLILQFAMRGIGAAFIVEDFARQAIAEGKLREVMLKKPLPPRRFLLAHLKKIPLSAASKKFVAAISADIKHHDDEAELDGE